MLILAFDTSLQACAAVVWRDGSVLARRREDMARGQAERLTPMIAEVMAEAGVGFDAIDRIAVTCGPGSFTGVRVGIATARGLALAAGKPACGIGTAEALVAAIPVAERSRADRLIAAIDSQRGDLFVQPFSPDLVPLAAPANLAAAEAASLVDNVRACIVGDGAAMLQAAWPHVAISSASGVCDPAVVATLAAGRGLPVASPTPIYVRPPDVTVAAPRELPP